MKLYDKKLEQDVKGTYSNEHIDKLKELGLFGSRYIEKPIKRSFPETKEETKSQKNNNTIEK